eukprot:943665-Rhodomonas_salina.1
MGIPLLLCTYDRNSKCSSRKRGLTVTALSAEMGHKTSLFEGFMAECLTVLEHNEALTTKRPSSSCRYPSPTETERQRHASHVTEWGCQHTGTSNCLPQAPASSLPSLLCPTLGSPLLFPPLPPPSSALQVPP